jgi:hypothetical protein
MTTGRKRGLIAVLVIPLILTTLLVWLAPAPQAQVGGWAHPLRLNALGNTVTPIISNRGGSLVMLHCNNPNTSVVFVQVFDSATNTAVALGTTTRRYLSQFPQATHGDTRWQRRGSVLGPVSKLRPQIRQPAILPTALRWTAMRHTYNTLLTVTMLGVWTGDDGAAKGP